MAFFRPSPRSVVPDKSCSRALTGTFRGTVNRLCSRRRRSHSSSPTLSYRYETCRSPSSSPTETCRSRSRALSSTSSESSARRTTAPKSPLARSTGFPLSSKGSITKCARSRTNACSIPSPETLLFVRKISWFCFTVRRLLSMSACWARRASISRSFRCRASFSSWSRRCRSSSSFAMRLICSSISRRFSSSIDARFVSSNNCASNSCCCFRSLASSSSSANRSASSRSLNSRTRSCSISTSLAAESII
mmetsp:Transcript_24354/g.68266  ORF Transcript_24354/g.68266 Transcript_24354/m.68266 type:complete len:249 (-) Transcript_24354:1113-1859(-)